jgi:NADPH-dependent curcumin reductase CurA
MSITIRSVHQIARPEGPPKPSDFAFVEHAIPDITAGTALVENIYLSVDPYMRELMDSEWPLGEPLGIGGAIGRVVQSSDPALTRGQLIKHSEGWSTHAVVRAGQPGVRVVHPPDGIPLSAYLSVLTPHVQSGRIKVDQTIVQGFEHVVDAFLGVLRGDNVGKMLVQVCGP